MAQRMQLDIDHDDEDAQLEAQKKKNKELAWRFDRSWDLIQEDEAGRLKAVSKEDQVAIRRRRAALIPGIKRGLVRYAVLAIDMSAAMNDPDMKPSRGIAVLSMCEDFVQEFFDQNPIAHMAIISTSNGVATLEAPIGSSPKVLCAALSRLSDKASFRGDASLQNLLELGQRVLDPIPPYGSKEIITVFGSLSTTDPGDIMTTVASLAEKKVKCTIVGLAAEVYVLRQVAKKTQGDYSVATHEDHFLELLTAQVPPRPLTDANIESSLVEMGFPVLKVLDKAQTFFDVREGRKTGIYGYECPKCSVLRRLKSLGNISPSSEICFIN
mmetsp:Transcript_11328/g.34681  ORF Transcript_11328/g.34681 Transcript_11328/m.34681 type:complete len:326 (+) Transcript_11328:63-1040(+)